MKPLSFIKMHGLGNDFVIIRDAADNLTPERVEGIADRRCGIGCDQLLVLGPPQDEKADLFMRIYNPDGSQAQACGNGTRCAAYLWMGENGRDGCIIQTVAGLLECRRAADDMVQVDMGAPRFGWRDIPLAEERDTLHLGVVSGELHDPAAVNIGNPHTVFFVENAARLDIETLGSQIECHVLFPERTNVEFVEVLGPDRLRVRVWERGTGVTSACGSGACASLVAAARRGLAGRKAEIILDGGSLFIEWREKDSRILMTGPAAYVFEGKAMGAQ